ncbi:hypothetical protein HYPDE_26148 [Hyphomicrobium denitrificans 1NES1]|uniref:Sulfur globule protein n=1 Tax=Hyphomicrobium denitrificans 1NES1 TaxID=670307 RepID=N0B3Z3_9HYPH|nr:hypothetical protein HYPDE_26148 [Hyphomicrobium denitrificans 1NES1]
MKLKSKIVAVGIVVLLAVAGAFAEADARSPGHSAGGHSFARSVGRPSVGMRSFRGRGASVHRFTNRNFRGRQVFRGRNFRRHGRWNRRYYYGWYGYPYYYGNNCAWIYQRALVTGSAYWWNRYYDCIGY